MSVAWIIGVLGALRRAWKALLALMRRRVRLPLGLVVGPALLLAWLWWRADGRADRLARRLAEVRADLATARANSQALSAALDEQSRRVRDWRRRAGARPCRGRPHPDDADPSARRRWTLDRGVPRGRPAPARGAPPMIARFVVTVAIAVLLAGCTAPHRPEPQVRMQRVEVPVPVPCIRADEIPAAPASPVDRLTRHAALGAIVKALLAERRLREVYEHELEAVLVACSRSGSGPE